MTTAADVVIAGAGVIGCAIARALARRGLRIVVIDPRGVGAGATQASAGMLTPYIEAAEGGALLPLTVRSLDLYESWIAELRAEVPGEIAYARSGTIEVAFDQVAVQRLRELKDRCTAREPMIWLDAAAALDLEPALSESILGALSVPVHGYTNASALTSALADAAQRHGAVFHAGARVSTVAAVGDHVEVTTDDGRSWPAGRVVIAAGSWSGGIAGLEDRVAQHLRPVRGQLVKVAWRGRPLTRVMWGPACYVVPWRDGSVLIGATTEEAGFEERNTVAGVAGLLEAACRLMPQMADATFLDARSGLRPATSDRLPIIGFSPVSPRIVYATGHYRNGILLAPLTAALVENLVCDDGQDPALAVVSPARF